jgi:hypothetical protein
LVVVNYYSRNYHNKTITGAFSRLDTAISRTVAGFHVKLANTFAAFARPSDRKAGNACTAGLLIELPHTCNIHPTAKGRQLLADTVVRAAR